MGNEKHRVTLFVLNDFLKFDRKIYQLLGIRFGRPIKMKTILYFGLIFGVMVAMYVMPVLTHLINWLPPIFYVVIPGVISYLLTDVRTEGRLPVAFFRSLFLHGVRKMKGISYGRGREIKNLTTYQFKGYSTIAFGEDRSDQPFEPKKVKFKNKKRKSKITNYSRKRKEKSHENGSFGLSH